MRDEGSQLSLLMSVLRKSTKPPSEDVGQIKELADLVKTAHAAGEWKQDAVVKARLVEARRLVLDKAKFGGPTVMKALQGWKGLTFD